MPFISKQFLIKSLLVEKVEREKPILFQSVNPHFWKVAAQQTFKLRAVVSYHLYGVRSFTLEIDCFCLMAAGIFA